MAAQLKILNSMGIRKDFPILSRMINGKPLAYLDNAATTQKPKTVIEATSKYYSEHNANIHRGIHTLSEEATSIYEQAHKDAAKFIQADEREIIFTKNTTESLNLLAYSLGLQLKKGDEIILTEGEHHSNLVPWQQISKLTGATVKYARLHDDGTLDVEHYKKLLGKKTRIVSAYHVSNVLGSANPVREMAEMAHEKGAIIIVDGAQSVPRMPVSVKKLGCDFLAFSSHKMLGPTGIGVLFGKKELLESMRPFLYGGDMIREVSYEDSSFNELPWKFEAGTPNIAGAAGFSAAINYLNNIGMDKVQEHEKTLTNQAEKAIEPHAIVYGPSNKLGVVSFNLLNIHPHDVAAILDMEGIAIRAGHHCAMPLMKKMGVNGTARASFYIYNTPEEIERLAEALEKVRQVFK